MEIQETISKKEVEDLIDRKILESKLIITEKRLQYFLVLGAALFAIFGIIFPMYLTSQSTDKVEKAIEKMENRFDELAGSQILKPEIDCFVDGKRLENTILLFDKTHRYRTVQIRNEGAGIAKFVRMRLYLDIRDKDLVNDFGQTAWVYANFNDKPGFKYMLEQKQTYDYIAAKDSITAGFWVHNPHTREKDVESSALLVIFYGEPEPREINFTFKINSKE